ncbi:thiol reductant ABC exporter subunit CydC [Gryllotalpicola reticulitermitis]|uniref:Thiol reductant ABC exporter subunit CydC n=1 Tax=Gryllotalpicola reticulitermitis TaxID=1184153 RepID=A0ABV8QBF0_9MICO
MKPILDDLGRPALYLLGLLGAAKAAGLVLVAQGVASGLSALLAHDDGWRGAVWIGLLGALLRGAAAWVLQVASARVALGAKERLRARVLDRAVADARGTVGATTTLATAGLDELDRYYTVFLPTLVSAATVPLLVGLRILAADWVSALIVVLTIPLIPVFMALIGVHTRDSVSAATTALGRLSDHMVELARGLPVLIGLGRVREQSRALRELSEKWRETSIATLRTAFLSALALELIATLSVAIVAVFVGVRLVGGTMTLEAGLLALILTPECYAPFRDIGAAFHASQTGLDARKRVQDALEAPVPESAPAFDRADAASSVLVHDLSVTHAGRTVPAVSGLSLAVAPGELLSLDGASGAGKSTVLQVLAGRGAALADGARLSGRVALPAPLAYLPQHPQFARALASDELRAYGATDVSAAALLAELRLPDADPARLSPGEQRRLAFARVMARVAAGARVALLDEPTAHLDEASARVVRAKIAHLCADGVAVVVASHDAELRALATRHASVDGAPALRRPDRPAMTTGYGEDVLAGRETPSLLRTGPEVHEPRDPHEWRHAGRELRRVLAPAAGKVALAVLLGTLAALFAAALTALSGWLIVRAAEHPPILFLEVAIVGVRFFGIGRAALRYSERLLTHDAVFSALTELRMRLWRGLAAQGPAGRVQLTAANTLDRLIGDGDRVRDLVPRVVIPLISGVVASAAAVVALWILWPAAGLVLLVACMIALVGGATIAVAADARATRSRDRDRSLVVRRTAALLSARDDLAANGAAAGELQAMAALDAQAAASVKRTAGALGAGGAIAIAICSAAAMAMIALGAAPTQAHALAPAVVAVLALTPLALIDPILEAISAAQRWPELAQVLARVSPVTGAADAADAAEPGRAVTAVQSIRFDDVGFRYPRAPRDVFAGINARLLPGDTLVVRGPSGSGKTTLLGVLLRYLSPTAGDYLVNDTDAGSLDADELRRRIAWCPQEGHLFDSTLRGNLAIARGRDERPTDAELTGVLNSVGLGPLLAALPLGLDTPIGAGGSFLSGGQRQRVAVARTLLAGSDVVLLDEPTAHLDDEAADLLLADVGFALREKTQVLVTHDARRRPDAITIDLGREAPAPANVARAS